MATFLAIDDFNNEDFAIIFVFFKSYTKLKQIDMNHNLSDVIYTNFKVF